MSCKPRSETAVQPLLWRSGRAGGGAPRNGVRPLFGRPPRSRKDSSPLNGPQDTSGRRGPPRSGGPRTTQSVLSSLPGWRSSTARPGAPRHGRCGPPHSDGPRTNTNPLSRPPPPLRQQPSLNPARREADGAAHPGRVGRGPTQSVLPSAAPSNATATAQPGTPWHGRCSPPRSDGPRTNTISSPVRRPRQRNSHRSTRHAMARTAHPTPVGWTTDQHKSAPSPPAPANATATAQPGTPRRGQCSPPRPGGPRTYAIPSLALR